MELGFQEHIPCVRHAKPASASRPSAKGGQVSVPSWCGHAKATPRSPQAFVWGHELHIILTFSLWRLMPNASS